MNVLSEHLGNAIPKKLPLFKKCQRRESNLNLLGCGTALVRKATAQRINFISFSSQPLTETLQSSFASPQDYVSILYLGMFEVLQCISGCSQRLDVGQLCIKTQIAPTRSEVVHRRNPTA